MECAILFIVFVVLLVFGVPIALCLVAAGALVVLAGGDISPIIIGQRMFGSLDSFTIWCPVRFPHCYLCRYRKYYGSLHD